MERKKPTQMYKVPQRDKDTLGFVEVLYRDPCVYCGKIEADTVDHVRPISRGGSYRWKNMTSACRHCNSRKGAKSLVLFLAQLTRERTLNREIERKKREDPLLRWDDENHIIYCPKCDDAWPAPKLVPLPLNVAFDRQNAAPGQAYYEDCGRRILHRCVL